MTLQADSHAPFAGRAPVRDDAQLRPVGGAVPPQDLVAEAAVLSAVIVSPEGFDRVQEFLAPDHFYSDANRHIYEAVVALQAEGQPVDMVTVRGWLKDRNRLEQVGGSAYLVQLTDATPAVANVEAHARAIHAKWRLRKLIGACQRFAAEGYGDCGEVQGFIDQAEQAVFEIARIPEGSRVRPVKDAILGAFEILENAAKRGGAVSGIPTGFYELDRKCAGLHDGDLYIVAGRPGMGKTAFVLNVAVNVASPMRESADSGDPYSESAVETPGYGVGFFSLEMPREQLASRLLAAEARVDVGKIRAGNLKSDDWNKLTDAANRLSRLPLWIDDSPALTILDLRAKVRRLMADIERGGEDGVSAKRLGLVVIDYLQLMQGRRGASSREQEISEMSRGLKQLAKELGVPVLALSQLNRSVETRTTKDKRPQLSDLRESGAIEQDADAIIFIYRDEYYFPESPDQGQAEIILAKQRNGPTGKVQVRFTREFTRFDNLAREDYEVDQFDEFDPGDDFPGP